MADTSDRYFLILGDRNTGKTAAGAKLTVAAASDPDRCGGEIAIIAPTLGAIGAMVEAIKAASDPGTTPEWLPGWGFAGRLVWPNRVTAACFSADKPDRVRGHEVGFLWGDNVDLWVDGETHAHLDPGVRLGPSPMIVYAAGAVPSWMPSRATLILATEAA